MTCWGDGALESAGSFSAGDLLAGSAQAKEKDSAAVLGASRRAEAAKARFEFQRVPLLFAPYSSTPIYRRVFLGLGNHHFGRGTAPPLIN